MNDLILSAVGHVQQRVCACVDSGEVKVSSSLTHQCCEEGLSSGITRRAEVLIILQISDVSITLSLLLIVPLGALRSSLWEHFMSITSTPVLMLFCFSILVAFRFKYSNVLCRLFHVSESLILFIMNDDVCCIKIYYYIYHFQDHYQYQYFIAKKSNCLYPSIGLC